MEFANVGAGTTTRYYHDGVRVIQERDAADNLVRSHVHGAQYLDEHVSTFESSGGRAGRSSYYLLGANFSVVGVGDADGSAVTRLEYSPAGDRVGPGGGLFFDADDDGDLDLADWVSLAGCLTGPTTATGPGCGVHDFTRDGAVDLADAAEFQRYFSGEGNPASPACRRAGSYAHDADGDGDVDIDDYLSYELCLTAPPDEPPDAVCLAFHDFDVAGESDGRVDLDDFGGLANCFRGSGQTPPPECFRPAPAGEVPGSGSFALHGSMVDVLSGGRGPGDELALQYSRARYFDLKHGRFLQRDPKGYIDGANLYEAFGSNPARFTDPMGTLTLEWHMRITLAAMDQTEFAPPANGVFRTAILIGSLYPDVPLQEVQALVGREMDPQTVLTVVDAYNKNWFVRAYRSVGATIGDYCVPDILLDNCVSNDIRDWWNSTSFVDPAINAAAWAWPEVEDTLMYRTHKGDLQWWHGMAEGGTAEAMNRKLLARMLLPVAEYRGSPANPNAGFLIGNALHTVQDLYTPPHVERDPDGLIIRHQDYAAQSSVYHAEKDVLDLNKPEDRDLYYTLVNRSALYLSALQEYRAGNLDETRLKRLLRESYLTAVPGGPAMGGTASQYAPRPSVTGEVIDATGRAARWTYNQGVRAYRWAGNIYERVNQWWNE